MGIAVGCAIERADAAIASLGHSPSTLWQYRWAWSRFAEFCACRGVGEVTGEIVDEFVHLARCDFEQGRIKETRIIMDTLGLMMQLGAFTQPGA